MLSPCHVAHRTHLTREGPCLTVPKASCPPRHKHLPCSCLAAPLHNASLPTKGCKNKAKTSNNIQPIVQDRHQCAKKSPEKAKIFRNNAPQRWLCLKKGKNVQNQRPRKEETFKKGNNVYEIVQKRHNCAKKSPNKAKIFRNNAPHRWLCLKKGQNVPEKVPKQANMSNTKSRKGKHVQKESERGTDAQRRV